MQQLTALVYKEKTYKSYNRAWNLFTTFLNNYGINLHDLHEQHMLEFVSYLLLAELALATIQLYFSGVRAHLCCCNLPSFKDILILKGVLAKFSEPDIRLPVTRKILHDMCSVLPLVVQDFYLVMLYRSMLTLVFHGLLRPGEFTYSPHVVRIENVFFDNGVVIIFLPTSKAHNKKYAQQIRVAPQRVHCPVAYLIDFLKVRPFAPGPLFVKQDNLPIQYPAVLTLFHDLAQFLDLPTQRYKPHSLRIGATTELHVKGFTNQVIQSRADGHRKHSGDTLT